MHTTELWAFEVRFQGNEEKTFNFSVSTKNTKWTLGGLSIHA